MRIVIVVGTRPTFIDLAPLIHNLKDRSELLIYNTSQHYDREMSDIFIEQLNIPEPYRDLESKSGTHAQQTSRIMVRCEEALIEDRPDIIIVKGDTNSALGAALAAAKLKIPIIHIEAGCRAFDRTLPEEINRVIITHITTLHFPPTMNCKNNLLREGIDEDDIGVIGHPVVDSINLLADKISNNIHKNEYYYVTIHRDFNTDNKDRLEHILSTLNEVAEDRDVIFAIHPRTKKKIEEYGFNKLLSNIIIKPPVDYITSLSLIKHAYAVITDSGGLTKESCILGTPLITLRPNTEWIETLQGYANQLAFADGNNILECIKRLDDHYEEAKESIRRLNIFGKVGISKHIVDN
ncbi:MAG: UDP-N-acetylglucosamine 2-epimerase (non-hydrolyzing), partial [Candidatus Nitrosothermus koennekii]